MGGGRQESRIGDIEISRLYMGLQELMQQGKLPKLLALMTPEEKGELLSLFEADPNTVHPNSVEHGA